jgi:hypothetical protein
MVLLVLFDKEKGCGSLTAFYKRNSATNWGCSFLVLAQAT